MSDDKQIEEVLEHHPQYLRYKEEMIARKMAEEDSEFYHPCQNQDNTMTLLSADKKHEIDVEIRTEDSTALINIIKVDHADTKSFIDLLNTVSRLMQDRSVKTVYQYVMPIDWETRLKDIEGFDLVNQKNGIMGSFITVSTSIETFVDSIVQAMGFNQEVVKR